MAHVGKYSTAAVLSIGDTLDGLDVTSGFIYPLVHPLVRLFAP
jgi:hypothetical protein